MYGIQYRDYTIWTTHQGTESRVTTFRFEVWVCVCLSVCVCVCVCVCVYPRL